MKPGRWPSRSSGSVRIVRQRAPERFTVVDNDVLEDERITFRARGILGFLLSRPDGWETSSERLASASPGEGRDAVRTALRELESVGYLARRKIQDSSTGRWATITAIVDRPTPENPSSGPRRLGNRPSADRTSAGQAPLPSTDTKHGDKALVVAVSDQPPPRTPGGHGQQGEAASITPEVHELVAELRTHRKAAGLTTARWTARAVDRAMRTALAAGYAEADLPAALMSIALDPATQTPGRLPNDGPWWDAAEIARRNQERAEYDRQRRVAELAAQAVADAEEAARRAACWRCDPDGRTRFDFDGRVITAVCTHGRTDQETA
jgi:hypothetical protein